MRYIIREISILRQLSYPKTKTNTAMFVPHIYDVLISERVQQDISKIKYLFIVMEFGENDL